MAGLPPFRGLFSVEHDGRSSIPRMAGFTRTQRKDSRVMDIQLGTNVLRNTNGTFFAHGKEHLRIERRDGEKNLMLNMNIFMPSGTEVATLYENKWEKNPGDRFVLTENPEKLTIQDTTLNTLVIQLEIHDAQTLSIPTAKFYTSKGILSEISAEGWRVGNKMELKNVDIDLGGGGIELPE